MHGDLNCYFNNIYIIIIAIKLKKKGDLKNDFFLFLQNRIFLFNSINDCYMTFTKTTITLNNKIKALTLLTKLFDGTDMCIVSILYDLV